MTVNDKKIQDPSNGGTSPQSYVNISSGNPDQTYPSTYFYYDGSTIFLRFRVESSPLAYSGGASIQNADPYAPASWVLLLDVNGDGWRDFALFLDGGSGGPGNPIDDIKVIYSNVTGNQSIDPATAGVYLLSTIKTAQAYTSGPYAGKLKQFDGNGFEVLGAPWPLGRNTTVYDFGTSRYSDSSTTNKDYLLEFQIPISVLDASAYGGPIVTGSTRISMGFTTANSNVNPFQKDFAYLGTITPSSTLPFPGGDNTDFDGNTVYAPIVSSVTASGCPNVTLKANVFDAFKVVGNVVTSTVDSVVFYYWYDADGNGIADDAGSSWMEIGLGTAGPLGTWTKSWTTSSLPQGLYIIKVLANDEQGNWTDSYTQNVGGYTQKIALFNNSCGTSLPFMTKTVTPSTVLSGGSTAQRSVTYTIAITNSSSSAITVSSISDLLPAGFSYQSNASGGSLTPTTSPSANATGTVQWTFSPAATILAGHTDSLKINVLAGTSAGTFKNSVSAIGSVSILGANNTATVTVTDASASLTKTVSPSTSVVAGNTLVYSLTYTNNGSVSLSNVTITDSLVAGLTHVGATNSGSFNASTRKITWSIGTVAVGASATVRETVQVSNPFSGVNPLSNYGVLTATELTSSVTSNSVTSTVASPQLTIDLSATPANVIPGDVITYTITYGNNGSASATNDTIQTRLPDNVTYVSNSASTTPTSVSGQVLKWGFASIASGSLNNTITFQASVNSYSSAVHNSPIIDTAFIWSSQTSAVSDTATVYVSALPNVTITKTADSTSYNGATAKFKFTLSNYGIVPATISSFVDSLPSGFTYVNGSSQGMATANPSGTTGRITWTSLSRTTLAAGATDTLVFQATIPSTTGTYTNTGKAKGTLTTAGTTDSISSSVTVVKNSTAGAIRNKAVNKTSAYAGDTLTYTIFFQNSTGGNQNNLHVIDTLPSGLTYLSYTFSGTASGGVRSFSSTGNVLDWQIGNPFRSGENATLTVKVSINSTVANGTVLTNYARVKASWDSTTNSVSTTVLAPPRISITKKVSQTSAAQNTILTYTIVYRDSSGAGTSTNTILTDTLLSSNLSYVTGSANKGGAYSTVSGTGGRIVWNLGSLAAGTVDSVTFKAQLTAASGTHSNTATMTNNEGKRVSSSVSTTVAANPILSLTKSVDKTLAGPGDTLTYTLSLNNTGNGSASSVVLNDVIPANTTFISATPTATSAPSVGGTGTVSWTVGTFASGSSSYTIKVKINSPLTNGSVTAITNSASGTSTQIPTFSSNSVTTTVAYPNLSVNKTVDNTLASPGDNLTYTLTVTNSSLIAAPNNILIDTIPSNVTFVSATNGGSFSSGRVFWNLGTLDANSSASVSVTVNINSPLANSTKIFNKAYDSTSTVNGYRGSNTVQTTISSAPTLTLSLAVDSSTAHPGSVLTYTATYGNTGNDAADQVYLTIPIPSNSTYVFGSVSGTGASYDITNNRIIVSRSTLSGGTTGQTVTFQVTIASPLPQGNTTITATGTISASNAESVQSSASTTVTASPTINIFKSGPVTSDLIGSPTPKDTITYTISFSITGNAIVDSVYINDVLPANLLYLSSSPAATSAPSIGSNGTVKWSLGTATPDTSGTLQVTVTTSVAGTYVNQAKITTKQNPTGVTSNDVTTEVSATVSGTLTQTTTIYPGNDITITVDDADLKGDGLIVVTTVNTTTDETESIGLVETGTNTGVFTATVPTEFGTSAGTNNNGFFRVQAGDTLRTTYVDQRNASGMSATLTANTRVIGGITATLSANPVLIAANDSSVFTLTDGDLNKSAVTIESYSLTVTSSTGETEMMTFTETGANTGIFTKKVPTQYGTTPGTNNDGIFTVQPLDTIQVSYFDSLTASGGTGEISTFFRIGTVNFSTSSKSYQDLNGGFVKPPDTLQYTLTIKNTGTVAATNISLKDTVPTDVTILAGTISGGGTASGRVISWSPFTLAVGDSAVYQYQIQIDSTIASQTPSVNVATIDANGIRQQITTSFTPVNRPLMTMTKSSNRATAKPGDTIVYTITYSNIGTVPAALVTVSDSQPDNTTYVPNSVMINDVAKTDAADADEVTLSGITLQLNLGVIQPGESGTITMKVRVN